jgi:hypothetical protein
MKRHKACQGKNAQLHLFPPDVRASVRGRILDLRKEGVGLALRRLLKAWFPNRVDIEAN